jgi:cold shock CspA family protein
MPAGKVIGFITLDDSGNGLFVHANPIEGGSLRDNEQVKHELIQGQKGPRAESVTLIA